MSLRKHLSGTHPGLAGCRAPALRAKSHVLALEHLLVQTGGDPEADFRVFAHGRKWGKAREPELTLPGRKGDGILGEGVRELNPKG